MSNSTPARSSTRITRVTPRCKIKPILIILRHYFTGRTKDMGVPPFLRWKLRPASALFWINQSTIRASPFMLARCKGVNPVGVALLMSRPLANRSFADSMLPLSAAACRR